MLALKQNFRTSEQKKVEKLFLIYWIGSIATSAADLRVYSLEPPFGVCSSKYQNECRVLIVFFIYSTYMAYNIWQRRLLFTFILVKVTLLLYPGVIYCIYNFSSFVKDPYPRRIYTQISNVQGFHLHYKDNIFSLKDYHRQAEKICC